jgi:ferredoxin
VKTSCEIKEGILMRPVVNLDRCEGNAFCTNIAPDVFQLDDDEYAVVVADPVPADQEALVEKAIAECPRAALSREG